MRGFLVSHTHWDREWYRTFQAFRARLVDAVDRVLDLCDLDPGFRFLLDGQTAVLEDYAEIRPERVEELRARCSEGRIAIGPWYVQPDSLLPQGESHVRNLLMGRRAGARFGPVSRVGYTPDSFGHPAQFPQLLRGFGIESFVYWRGNGAEIDELPAEYRWVAPEGSEVLACHLGRGYFCAASDPMDSAEEVASRVADTAKELAARTRSGAVLLMNGIDHAPPELRSGELAQAIARASGIEIERSLLEDFVAAVADADPERPAFRGELVGGRVAPLLPGVWSTRTWIKLANRRAEAALLGWAEPFAALAERLGGRAEHASLALAWRELLRNHAHDSICGCSRDEVHEQMRPRFAAARELADETAARALDWLAGAGPERRAPWTEEPELAVFNPSPHPRTEVLRFALDPHPYMVPATRPEKMVHPFHLHDLSEVSFEAVVGAEARAVRRIRTEEPGRVALVPGRGPHDLELVVSDVPAFGWKRVRLRRSEQRFADEVQEVEAGSEEAEIGANGLRLAVELDGRFRFASQAGTFSGLAGIEDVGDRGDSYDFDPVPSAPPELDWMRVERRRHPAGFQALVVDRSFSVPQGLAEDRRHRSQEEVGLRVCMELRLAEGVPRVDGRIRVWNTARDHRLRLLFPLGEEIETCEAATTFDVAARRLRPAGAPKPEGWVQPPPDTFACQGFARVPGLTVGFPGLPEAALVAGEEGTSLAVTLLRSVGALSQLDLATRPGPAGPAVEVPGAQCPGLLEARFFLWPEAGASELRDAELGLRAVAAGVEPRVAMGRPLLSLEPRELLLSAMKPAEEGEGVVIRISNPTVRGITGVLRTGFPWRDATPLRLDEKPCDARLEEADPETGMIRIPVPPHGLRSVWLRGR